MKAIKAFLWTEQRYVKRGEEAGDAADATDRSTDTITIQNLRSF